MDPTQPDLLAMTKSSTSPVLKELMLPDADADALSNLLKQMSEAGTRPIGDANVWRFVEQGAS